MGGDVQPEFGGRTVAGDGGPGRVGGGQARALGIARCGAALHVGQVVVQPALALRQRLRMRVDGLDARQGVGLAQQVVAHQQAGLAHHLQRCVEEQVERARHHPFGRVLDRHHSELGAARRGGTEHLVDAAAGDAFDAGAEILEGGLLAESAGRAQEGDPLRRFERPAGRHDLAPDRRQAGRPDRAGVALLQAADHGSLAFGPEYRRAFFALDQADLVGEGRAAVEELQHLRIDRVDVLS